MTLRGPQGQLDLYVVYVQAGDEPAEKQAKRDFLDALASHLRPRHCALSIIAGDWNFVIEKNERWCKRTGAWTGSSDGRESSYFKHLFRAPDREKLVKLE